MLASKFLMAISIDLLPTANNKQFVNNLGTHLFQSDAVFSHFLVII